MADECRYRAMCKASKAESGQPRFSQNWVLSRRGFFRVFSNRIQCGNLVIPFTSIRKATEYKVKYLFMPSVVLELTTEKETYQFGFNPFVRPADHIPVKFEHVNTKLKYSAYSIVMRILAGSLFAYWLWTNHAGS